MKYLVKSVAVAAGMAIAATAWSQGYPGPKPSGHQYGGSGYGISLSSPSTPATPSAATPPPASAASPTPRSKHVAHTKKTHHGPALTGSTSAQLNREEFARLQPGSSSTGPASTPALGPSQH